MTPQPKIYADTYRMVMVFPPQWHCESCGHRWKTGLKSLDVSVVVPVTDDNVCEKCGEPGAKIPKKEIVYQDRRCGVAWPGKANPGYFVIFGQQSERDHPSSTGYQQVDFLFENEEPNQDRFFDNLVAGLEKAHCKQVMCSLEPKHDNVLYALTAFLRQRNYQLRTFDMHEVGGFDEARGDIEALTRYNQLYVPATSILRAQSGRITPDDLHTINRVEPEERFYAVAAMNYVIASWRAYPWRKPGAQQRPPQRRPGYGG